MSDFPAPTRIKVKDIELSVHLAGPGDGQPLLLAHGWPELAYSWKNQIDVLARAGYRVIAPDLRGFGASDCPAGTEHYAVDEMVGDFTGLLDALGHEKAVFVGHDWGGILVWHAAMLAPERVQGVIGVNTPHLPRPSVPPTETFKNIGGEDHYVLRFQEDGYAERRFEGQEDKFFAFVFGAPPEVADIESLYPDITHLVKQFENFKGRKEEHAVVGPEDRKIYAEAYAKTGFAPGFGLYRNFDANWQRMGGVDHRLSLPCLMVAADKDFMLPAKLCSWMPALCKDVEINILEDCGHWTMWQQPDQLNAHMLEWLERRFPA
ncbi:MAG: alpha/beta hydrolase [Maricaulis sp.]|jgi:pimeloyl-ACP methyl ester carboxylesterase|nr:alpha/beta hydrolase [Maricaulis sp.]